MKIAVIALLGIQMLLLGAALWELHEATQELRYLRGQSIENTTRLKSAIDESRWGAKRQH